MSYNEKFAKFGLRLPNVLLPKKNINLNHWAVVACDQYTSEEDYWKKLEKEIGDDPSTLKIIYPEVYLDRDDKEERIKKINSTMKEYIKDNIFDEYKETFILTERETESGKRYGLVVALDLEAYDYSRDSKTLIRATEGTILSRIPPRKEIRENAELELPHILVLISDKHRAIIEKLAERKDSLPLLYDFDLIAGGGHIKGYRVSDEESMKTVYTGFEALYNELDMENPLLFAMGDGNHSLATAKSCWEDIKKNLSEEDKKTHPARYALLELENIYDKGLEFEPIHRVFFGLKPDSFDKLLASYCRSFDKKEVKDEKELDRKVNEEGQHFGLKSNGKLYVYTVHDGIKQIAAGTLQLIIDEMLKEKLGEVDYIHGKDVTLKLADKDGNIGIILPDVSKERFFSDMLKDGVYPRKTFSIGHANEKRYYMEARKIK